MSRYAMIDTLKSFFDKSELKPVDLNCFSCFWCSATGTRLSFTICTLETALIKPELPSYVGANPPAVSVLKPNTEFIGVLPFFFFLSGLAVYVEPFSVITTSTK